MFNPLISVGISYTLFTPKNGNQAQDLIDILNEAHQNVPDKLLLLAAQNKPSTQRRWRSKWTFYDDNHLLFTREWQAVFLLLTSSNPALRSRIIYDDEFQPNVNSLLFLSVAGVPVEFLKKAFFIAHLDHEIRNLLIEFHISKTYQEGVMIHSSVMNEWVSTWVMQLSFISTYRLGNKLRLQYLPINSGLCWS